MNRHPIPGCPAKPREGKVGCWPGGAFWSGLRSLRSLHPDQNAGGRPPHEPFQNYSTHKILYTPLCRPGSRGSTVRNNRTSLEITYLIESEPFQIDIQSLRGTERRLKQAEFLSHSNSATIFLDCHDTAWHPP